MSGRLGETDGVGMIVMHPDQSQVQRRCTIAHELAHVELGHTGGCAHAEEQAARELAARWLIEIEDLAEAVLWARSRDELADELWVDLDTLDARLGRLHPAERHYLRRRVAAREHTP
jgi:Zn-dependent peptidase ImmA (M78 family)